MPQTKTGVLWLGMTGALCLGMGGVVWVGISKMSIHDFYVMSNNQLEGLFGLKSFAKLTAGGKATNYYLQSAIDCLLPFVRVDSNSEDKIRTIHKAKGAEFNDVMVWVESLKALDQYIFDASTLLHGSVDNARKYYVAFSRAKKNLYICVPEMKPNIQKKLEGEGLKIEFMRSSPTIEKPRTLFDFD